MVAVVLVSGVAMAVAVPMLSPDRLFMFFEFHSFSDQGSKLAKGAKIKVPKIAPIWLQFGQKLPFFVH